MPTETTAHTPGPWVVQKPDSQNRRLIHAKDATVQPLIGEVWGHEGDEAANANARLIARAPDMLARIAELEAALTKIADQSMSLKDHVEEQNVSADDGFHHLYAIARAALKPATPNA